jgi:hypothetical protein
MNGIPIDLVSEFVINVLGPWGAFELVDKSLGDTNALIVSALPPLAWSIIELVRTRRTDAISVVVITGILLTLVATMLGGSPRLLQIRENAVTGLIGVAFLLTLGLERPLIYYLARATFAREGPEAARKLEAVLATSAGRAFFRRLTLFWGVGLIMQTAVLVWLVFIWPIGRFLLLSPIIGYGLLGLMLVWTVWSTRRLPSLRAVMR